MANIIQLRRDTAANWTSANPVLNQGEMGFETDTLKLKLGNGVSHWSALEYYFVNLSAGTSTTSITVGLGTKTFTTQAGKLWSVGEFLLIASASNSVYWMFGQVSSYTTTSLVMDVQHIGSVGTKTDWNITVSGIQGIQGIQGIAGVSLVWESTYDAGTTYSINDIVYYLGSSYIWINPTPSSNHLPTDGTYWDLLVEKGETGDKGETGSQGIQGASGSIPVIAAGGTSDAITATFNPAITLADTQLCCFIASAANTTTTPTFAPNGLTAHTIVKKGGSALAVGDIPAQYAVCLLEYNLANTRWELLNPVVNPTFTETVTVPAIKITTGAGANKILTSDADGDATWEDAAGGGGSPFLTNLLYPSQNGGHRDIVRAGWKPAFFNQQWGGSPILGGLDGDLKMDYASGYFGGAKGGYEIGYDNTYCMISQGFKTSNAITLQAVWLKLYKIGNPIGNVQIAIYDNNAGVPNAAIANGAATAQAGTLHSQDTNGTWYRFVFATPPSLSANTLYHIVGNRSDANSTTNCWAVKADTTLAYPQGGKCVGTNVPVWTANSNVCLNFAIEPTSAYRFLQSGGAFDYKLVGNEGTPLDQSYGLTASLKDIGFNPYEFTWKGTFTDLAKSKPFAEFMYGLDHDRISLATDSDGHVNLVIYEDNATVHTIAGTTDVSSGTFDIGIYVRAKGDGSDVATLYINGTADDSHTGLTLTFDYIAFRELGTAWLLGGFPVCPAWTKETLMGSLPAADGWTYDGTATEAAHAVVSGGKLYQQIVGSTDICSWHIPYTFNNANGWCVSWKNKVVKSSDVTKQYDAWVYIYDGTKEVGILMHSYWVEITYDGITSAIHKTQIDLTKQEHTFIAIGKGADFYLLCDGKFIVDGTGLMIDTSANNQMHFGDADATASANSEVVWDYVKYYETAAILPQFNSGALSEAALWSGNMTPILLPLYNAGTRISVKQYCGVSENYVKWVKQNVKQEGITSSPTTTSTSFVLLTDMERFIYGEAFLLSSDGTFSNDTANKWEGLMNVVDGVSLRKGIYGNAASAATSDVYEISIQDTGRFIFGLHKAETKWRVPSNTGSNLVKERLLSISEVE